MPAFHGIYPMLYAFFGSDGRLDRRAMGRQIEACIAAGAHGVAALGLATEVGKLSREERLAIMAWTAEDVAGRVPVAYTVNGRSVDEQCQFVQVAAAEGAAWVILQPPLVAGISEQELIRFFGAVCDRSELPVAIQNAPEYMGVGLTAEGIETLRRNHGNLALLKGEGPAVDIAEVVELTGGRLDVFNGRNGLELPDNLRAGCAGMIPSCDTVEHQVAIYERMRGATPALEREAEAIYRRALPAISFAMQSIDHLLCYGKRITAGRLGLQVHDREPCTRPTAFGIASVARIVEDLGPLPGVNGRPGNGARPA